jgi:hypothetical protein
MVDDREYPIETDFRTCLRVIMAFEDTELTSLEKQIVLLENLYPERPENLSKAFEQGVKFLNGGKRGEEEKEGLSLRLFSFERDAALIFSAFQQTHGIDLENTQYLHWWKFMALFMDLGPDTTFCNLINLRRRIKSGTASKEERKTALELGELFEVPEADTRTPEEREREAEFMRLVTEAQRKRNERL